MLILSLQSMAFGADQKADLLKGIQDKYSKFPGITVTYTREVITRSMSMLGDRVKGDLATGRLYFRPPHFIRLEQETPEPETIIADSETLWWYVPKKKTVYKYPSQKFAVELRLLSDVFKGLTKVEEGFDVSLLGRDKDGRSMIELRPNPPWVEIDHLVISATKEYEICQVDIQNQMGNLTIFRLEDLTVRKGFKEGFFRFSPLEGVIIVDQEDPGQSPGTSSQ